MLPTTGGTAEKYERIWTGLAGPPKVAGAVAVIHMGLGQD